MFVLRTQQISLLRLDKCADPEETGFDLVLDLVRNQRAVHPRMGGKKLYHILKGEIERLGLKLEEISSLIFWAQVGCWLSGRGDM